VDVNDERVRVLEIEPEIPQRQIALAWHGDRHRSPAARAFLELASEVCSDVSLELPQRV
jgi:DNA-binding transcriptional LysR family regulator